MAPYAAQARRHPGGLVDLSIGSPVDATPALIREALASATDAHAYPQTVGTPALREAIVGWFRRRRGVDGLEPENVLPTIGSKELVAFLPFMLGLGEGDVVVHPRAAYPTYAIGAAIAGAEAVASDDPAEWPENTRLVWLNSPGNPDGRVLSVDELRAAAPARPRTRRGRRERRVLCGAGLGGAVGWGAHPEHPRPPRHRRRPHGSARCVLAEQAVESRRLPCRVHRRLRRLSSSVSSWCASTPA